MLYDHRIDCASPVTVPILSEGLEISDEEVLVRAVTSYGLKQGKLKKEFFLQRDDFISVSRHPWVPAWLVNAYAKALVVNRFLNPPKTYAGLAFLSASAVRRCGATIVDSRSEYLGHADLSLGIRQDVGEALTGDQALAREKRAEALLGSTTYIIDPFPERVRWRPSPNHAGLGHEHRGMPAVH